MVVFLGRDGTHDRIMVYVGDGNGDDENDGEEIIREKDECYMITLVVMMVVKKGTW